MPRLKPSERTPLTRARILEAALRLIDEEGLAALSMRRVGAELGVEAMSLYNHVPNKAALLDGVHERILEDMQEPKASRRWTDVARQQARALRRSLCAHPNAITLFATGAAATHASLTRLEKYLAVLDAAGFRTLDALNVVQVISAYVVGHAMWSVAPSAAAAVPYLSLPPDEFPNVRAMAAILPRYDPDAEFEKGLDALLQGFEARRPKARG